MIALANPPVVVQSDDGKVFQFPTPQNAEQFETSVKEAGGETLRLVPEVLPAARPLYDLEAHLAALVDTEDLVPEELEQEYALELQATLLATVEERDRVGQFLAHLESQIAFAHAEVARLKAREAFYERVFRRMEGYVTRVIESLGLGHPKTGVSKTLMGISQCEVQIGGLGRPFWVCQNLQFLTGL